MNIIVLRLIVHMYSPTDCAPTDCAPTDCAPTDYAYVFTDCASTDCTLIMHFIYKKIEFALTYINV